MPGQQLRLGPFVGGLNLSSDPTAIADAELVECLNFELDIDGSLLSRPAIQELDGHVDWPERIICICEGIFGTDYYIIGSNSSGIYYYLDGIWTLITDTFQTYAATQYGGFIYLVPEPGSANPGGKWSPSGGFTAVAAIPQGMAATVHKERLFIVPGRNATTLESRIRFSDPADLDTWPAGNFIDIGPGDGSKLLDITVYQDNLLLFKDKSTYLLAYDIRPADAVSRKVSNTIGVDRQYCMVNYENQVYVLHNGWVYEIINYDFNRINTKVPFVRDETSPSTFADEKIFLGLLGDRLIVRYFNSIYVYGLRTRSWSEWTSSEEKLRYFGPIVTSHDPDGLKYYAGSCLTAGTTIVQLLDERTTTSVERVISPEFDTVDNFSGTSSNGWSVATPGGQTWTIMSGAASTFSKAGGRGVISTSTKNTNHTINHDQSYSNFDKKITFASTVVATGDDIIMSFKFRDDSATNFYRYRVQFDTDGNIYLRLVKSVAGIESTIGASAIEIDDYSAGEDFTIRIRCVGTSIKAKVWKTANAEPGGWHSSETDSAHSSGEIGLAYFILTGNTNPLPIGISFDNLLIGDPADVEKTIECNIKTKNFDMAIPSQFKRMWWWGADISTTEVIVGIATPITVSFGVPWSALASFTWADLADNTWAQPLSTPITVPTTIDPGVGITAARRFVKFNKGLRYRQINFEVDLLTDGTTTKGPARLFALIVYTESKQTVSKSVN